MFLPEVDLGGSRAVHGFVRARWPTGGQSASPGVANWSRFFTRSALLWEQLRPLSMGLRLAVAPGGPLTSVHSFVVPAADGTRLRMVLAAFLRTHGMGDAETDVPESERELTGAFTHAEDARFEVFYERLLTNRGGAIHFDLRLFDRVPRMLQSMADLGVPAAYEANATEWMPPREMLRTVLIDVARLEEDRSVPPDLLRDQRHLAARLRASAVQRPVWHVEECVSAPLEAAEALHRTAASLLQDTSYGLLGLPPRLRQVGAEKSEAFGIHVHSHLLGGTPDGAETESVAAAATKAELDRILSCAGLVSDPAPAPGGGGDPLFLSLGGPPPPPGGGFRVSGAVRPPPAGEKAPFLFVSYARNDKETVYPLLETLTQRGVSLWVDQRLLGGDDWLAELESRLLDCSGILALLSPSFADSKYCAREIHFGDALNRPIVPIALVPNVTLQRGLRLLLHPTQAIKLTDVMAVDKILASIRAYAAQTLSGQS